MLNQDPTPPPLPIRYYFLDEDGNLIDTLEAQDIQAVRSTAESLAVLYQTKIIVAAHSFTIYHPICFACGRLLTLAEGRETIICPTCDNDLDKAAAPASDVSGSRPTRSKYVAFVPTS